MDAIEWGGDVHVPHGNIEIAKETLALTRAAGLEVCSYGSYCRVLDENGMEEDFSPMLESALALEVDVVRIWAGQKPSAEADDSYRTRVANHARKIAEQAAEKKVRVAFEFHAMTLTDTNESAIKLMEEINHDNMYLYWQPMYWETPEICLSGLKAMKDRVLNLHVYSWGFDHSKGHIYEGIIHQPLADSANNWADYFAVDLPENLPHYALIEHSMSGTREQFMADAKALKSWLQ